jgi:predicted branched-subunit amino acid permease
MFAIAFGTAAAQKGLSLGETMGLSAFVYAGASQMVGLEIWQQVWSPATILTIVTVTAVVNARMILLGATLQPWLKDEPLARTRSTSSSSPRPAGSSAPATTTRAEGMWACCWAARSSSGWSG